MMIIEFIVTLLVLINISTNAVAGCVDSIDDALAMCQTKVPVGELNSKAEAISQRINPGNQRMSPSTCEGLSRAYDDFKSITENYIAECRKALHGSNDGCTQEAAGGKVTRATYNKWKGTRSSETPKLQHYLAPMDALKARLDDCLRDTRGQTEQAKSASTKADTEIGSGKNGIDSSAGQNAGGDSGGDSRGNAGGKFGGTASPCTKESGCRQSESAGQTGQDDSGRSSGDPSVNALVTSSYQASGTHPQRGLPSPGLKPGQIANPSIAGGSEASLSDRARLLARAHFRSPANSLLSRGISGRHSDLFRNVRLRYIDVHSRSELY